MPTRCAEGRSVQEQTALRGGRALLSPGPQLTPNAWRRRAPRRLCLHSKPVATGLLGNAVPAQSAGEAVADQLGPFTWHQRGRDAVPRVVVYPGQRFGGRAVGEQEAAH